MSTQRKYAGEVNECVREASLLLGGPGVPVYLDHRMAAVVQRLGVVEARTGFATSPVLRMFSGQRRGHSVMVGLRRLRLDCGGRMLSLVQVHAFDVPPLGELWILPAGEQTRLYRFLRREVRRGGAKSVAPIMSQGDWQRLYDNTIGFLRRGREELARYGVSQKRGVLLLGSPGNGKTMAGRWLESECNRLGLTWRHVTVEMYERMRSNGHTDACFELTEPGIVLFDDFELGLRHRDDVGPTSDHSVLLGELDGIESREGVVYVFTTNARLEELDPAFLRRGRIDQIITFPKPSADLRRRLIVEFWHAEILAALDVEQVVAETEGLSFAELSELKKLLVLHRFDSGEWNWTRALAAFRESPTVGMAAKGPIGFRPLQREDSVPSISAAAE